MPSFIRKSLLLKLFDAASMQRWNDKLRPFDLPELDKQAHKMIIVYLLGRIEESRGRDVNWQLLIEEGIFDFLRRSVLTDLKPYLFEKIKQEKDVYSRLNSWVLSRIESHAVGLPADFLKRMRLFFTDKKDSFESHLLDAAHFFATSWEFELLKGFNVDDPEIPEIKKRHDMKAGSFYDLESVKECNSPGIKRFIDICARMRSQTRWSHLYRIPRTSVLGHMFIVAIITYFFSLQSNACAKRVFNNFFTGLFHDLPEALTRDIINPVKTSIPGLENIIKDYEIEQMQELLSALPESCSRDICFFTKNEFSNAAVVDGEIRVFESLDKQFNLDEFSPRDGSLVKAADELAAFIEAYLALSNGINNSEFHGAVTRITDKNLYSDDGKGRVICGINMRDIYADFV